MATEALKLTGLLWGTEREQQRKGIVYAGGTIYVNERLESAGHNEVLRFKKIVAHLSGLPMERLQCCTVHELSKIVVFTFQFNDIACYITVDESRVVFIRPY